MAKQQIKPIETTKEKQETYKVLLEKYRKAMDEEFFIEAIMIAYSMMEDRLKSMIYHFGVFDSRNTLEISKVVKKNIENITGNRKYDFNAIKEKIAFIKQIIDWYSSSNFFEQEYSPYLKCLKDKIDGLDVDALSGIFTKLNKWLEYRNEVMHASMNKNIDSLYEGLKTNAEVGMNYARELDSYVRVLKKLESICKN